MYGAVLSWGGGEWIENLKYKCVAETFTKTLRVRTTICGHINLKEKEHFTSWNNYMCSCNKRNVNKYNQRNTKAMDKCTIVQIYIGNIIWI
jgi:hypothetical protein